MTVPMETPASVALVSCDRLSGYDWSDQAEEEFVNEPIVSEPIVKKPAVETSEAKASTDELKVVRKNFGPPLIQDWISDSKDEAESKSKIEQVSTAHPKSIVNVARPKSYLSNTTHLTVKRPIHKKIAFTNSNVPQKVNIVRSKTVNTAWPKAIVNVVLGNQVNAVKASAQIQFSDGLGPQNMLIFLPYVKGNPQIDLHDKGVIDSGCSRHMTGNMSYLIDYEEIDGGYVSFVGTKACDDAGKSRMETVLGKDYILLPLWTANPLISQESKISQDDRFQPSSDEEKKVDEDPRQESECKDQEKEDNVNSTNNVNAVSTNRVNVVDDYEMADMNNLDTTIHVSPTLNIRIHKDHPIDQRYCDKKQARLVTQGHTQEEEIDYYEVFAPVARIEAIRLFLAYASFKDFVVYQMDVKSAFLYEKIKEEVYVCQPLGFEDPDFPNKVYKLKKALYRLHQASRTWYETLSAYLLDNGFYSGKIDKTLFIIRHKDDILLVLVYVDDIIFVKNASIPMETQKPLLKDEDGEEVDVHMYGSMISSLMYHTSLRPDIMFAVYACAKYQVNPKVSHPRTMKGFLGT
nr:ribonuclease H-like domain, reverse transcriptase, RNA-dependent DNA polymerase [Tanacetum cinerariifolium]